MNTKTPAPRIKRFAALVYDSFLVTAILFLATFIALQFNHGESYGKHHIGFTMFLIFSAGLYIVWCWAKGGQTLGMKAWRLRMISTDNKQMTLTHAIVRYLWGVVGFWLAGVGFLWCLFDRQKQSLQDRIAGTSFIIENQ